jgi:hypothetical protein
MQLSLIGILITFKYFIYNKGPSIISSESKSLLSIPKNW